MTVETTTNRVSYTGSGTTGPFSVPFYFLEDDDLTVIKTTLATGAEETLVLTTDYTVSGAADPDGGSVTLASAASSAYAIVIVRDPDRLQATAYPRNDKFPAASHERALDKLTMLVQRGRDLFNRSFRLSDGDVSGVDLEISESAATRANKYLGFDSSGNLTLSKSLNVGEVVISDYMETVLDDTSASAARATLAALGTAGGTLTGDLNFAAGINAVFEGTADDAYEATLTGGDPTADRTIKLPDASGILACVHAIQDFRLTLTTAVPVTTADVTAASTLYATPKTGNQIALYTGTEWVIRSSAEFSLALSGLTSGKPYDVFCYDNAGVPTLEFLVWTNDSTRATALAKQDGVLIKSGAATRRYLGTFYTTGTTTTEDSAANRYLWNYYHRADRPMLRNETTATWTYTTNTWRQANNAAANQLNFIVGVAEESVFAKAVGAARNSAAQQVAYVGIGLDATNANSATLMPLANIFSSATHFVALNAEYLGMPAAGRHYLAWLEIDVTATNTTTWAGTQDSAKSGIHGMVRG